MTSYNWTTLWNNYCTNRKWANQLGHINKCAVVMSASLGLKPGKGELSLADIKEQLNERFQKEKWLENYFIRAQELANRLERSWGPAPQRWDRARVQSAISGKRGVIFFQDAWGGTDHIDLYNGKEIACRRTLDGKPLLMGDDDPFKLAKRIWFWPLQYP